MTPLRILIGWDSREEEAYRVAYRSLHRYTSIPLDVRPLRLSDWQASNEYRRPVENRDRVLWDSISQAPMSTEHALLRFLPIARHDPGWWLFCDSDVLFRADVAELATLASPQYAVMVVKRGAMPALIEKKAGQPQLPYDRKNWSSVMLVNGDHPAHQRLTLADFNTLPGRYLHRFCWLADSEIGALPAAWNHLAGIDEPKLVHFTLGTPLQTGEATGYAAEWRNLEREVRGG